MAIGVIGNDNKNKLISENQSNKYFKKEIYNEIDPNNSNESRSIMCANISEKSVVLDIGCAQGTVGKFLKENKNCTMYGIEIDKESIKYAEATSCYKKLYNFDICDSTNEKYKHFFEENLKFDYILFCDVLEHLIFPAEVLYNFGKLLKDNGKMLISLPNIAHYDIINGLLNENFNYSDMGILDNTHLRFFTRSSFAEYIESANKKYQEKYDLEWIGKTLIKPYFYGKYEKMDKFIEKNENLFILQNIFLCTKLKNNEEPLHLNDILKKKKIDLTFEINSHIDELSNINAILQKEKEILENGKIQLQKEKENLESVKVQLKKEINLLTNENNNKEQKIQLLEEVKYNQSQKIDELINTQNELVDNNRFIQDEINRIINSKSWKSTQFIRDFKAKRIKKKSRLNKVDNKQSILFMIHAWVNTYDKNLTNIGGTTLHLLDIIHSIQKSVNCYVLTIINGNYMLVVFNEGIQKIYDLHLKATIKNFDRYDLNFMSLLFEIIDNLKIDLVHIHHLQNFPCDLQFLPKRIKTIITIHDYFPICPKIQLINYENKLCANGKKLNCLKCTKNANIDFETRNTAIKNLLENAAMVIAPDESVFEELKYHCKLKNKVVIPHGTNVSVYAEKNKKMDLKIKNIAFVGVLTEHKGLNIVKDLVIKNDKADIQYHLFGISQDEYLNVNHKNYTYHGVYKQNELPKLLIENNIDLVIFPAIWPETFSYTLSETIIANIPCISYNLGAIANRVKKDKLGWVIDKNKNFKYTDFTNKYNEIFKLNNYKEIINNIKKFKSKNISQMIEETQKFYKQDVCKTKDYDAINDYLEKYFLRYTI